MKAKIRILHVDDNIHDRQLVKDALLNEHGDFEIVEAENREKFEQQLAENNFDLVLSDFNILGFDGLQVLQIVKERKPGLPVIIVTGTGSEEIAIQAMKMGATDYVIKSVKHIQGLVPTIKTVLKLKKMQDEVEKAQILLQESEVRLRELNATKDKFFSIIAHDLKNPFNAIIGFSNILAEQIAKKNYDGIEEYAGIIKNSSQRAMSLLTNLLQWSRSQTGKMEFTPEPIKIATMVNEIIELSNDYARQKSITISSKIPPGTIVFADKAMICTILRNLVSNAIKFTNPGGEIVISVQQKRDELVMSVCDNGVGISKDDIKKLFRIDENYTTQGTQKEMGTGLGLILCKEFILKHGGKIWVESEPGRGSTFYFTIPKI
jgi:signal transduction histidine kinase